MKKTMRKLFSFFVVFVMVLSIVQMPDSVSQAADTEITAVDVEVTIPMVGSDATIEYTADYEGYTVTSDGTYWLLGNSDEVYTIEEVALYGSVFTITPKDGYTLAQDVTITVNGSDEEVFIVYENMPLDVTIEFVCESQLLGMIDTIALTDVPEANIGDKAEPYSATGTNYTVNGTWSMWNPETKLYDAIDATHTFTDDNIYRLYLEVLLDEGYVFDYNISFTVNGKTFNDWGYGERDLTANLYISNSTPITEVVIDEVNFPKAVIGENFDQTPIEITVPEGSGYTAEAFWQDSYGNETGTFEDGEAYFLSVYVYADKGYYLSDDVKLFVGDVIEFPQWGDYASAFFYTRQSFATEISEVTLKNVPKAEIGEPITASGFGIEVPEDAPYTATGRWYTSNYIAPEEDEFEDGKSYYLRIDIEAKDGSEFADDIIFDIDGVKQKEHTYGHKVTNVDLFYSFAQLIDKVEVTGVTEPKAGEAPTVSGLKVPEGANYKIVDATWYESGNWGNNITEFKAGYEYLLEVMVEPNDGYTFDYETELFIEGESNGMSNAPTHAYLNKEYPLTDIIPKIELSNLPDMQVGQVAKTEITVPDGAPYTAEVIWYVWDDTEKCHKEFTGTFEAGKSYACSVLVKAYNGYGFDNKVTEFYVDGVLDKDGWTYGTEGSMWKEFSSGLKVIDRVEFTIDEPVVGQHSSIQPVITIPEGANYSFYGDEYSNRWVQESGEVIYPAQGYFVADKEYGARFTLCAGEGYMFSEDVVIVVNGIALGEDYIAWAQKDLMGYYFFDAECDHKYTDDLDAICDVCGYEREIDASDDDTGVEPDGTIEEKPDDTTEVKPDENPKTGDSFNFGLILMLMALCGTGIVLSARAKKEN